MKKVFHFVILASLITNSLLMAYHGDHNIDSRSGLMNAREFQERYYDPLTQFCRDAQALKNIPARSLHKGILDQCKILLDPLTLLITPDQKPPTCLTISLEFGWGFLNESYGLIFDPDPDQRIALLQLDQAIQKERSKKTKEEKLKLLDQYLERVHTGLRRMIYLLPVFGCAESSQGLEMTSEITSAFLKKLPKPPQTMSQRTRQELLRNFEYRASEKPRK